MDSIALYQITIIIIVFFLLYGFNTIHEAHTNLKRTKLEVELKKQEAVVKLADKIFETLCTPGLRSFNIWIDEGAKIQKRKEDLAKNGECKIEMHGMELWFSYKEAEEIFEVEVFVRKGYHSLYQRSAIIDKAKLG